MLPGGREVSRVGWKARKALSREAGGGSISCLQGVLGGMEGVCGAPMEPERANCGHVRVCCRG